MWRFFFNLISEKISFTLRQVVFLSIFVRFETHWLVALKIQINACTTDASSILSSLEYKQEPVYYRVTLEILYFVVTASSHAYLWILNCFCELVRKRSGSACCTTTNLSSVIGSFRLDTVCPERHEISAILHQLNNYDLINLFRLLFIFVW